MRYIYYIIAIVILFSALAAYGVFETKIEISKPYISVNDRIISEHEFNDMLKRQPGDMNREQFIESIIEKQLLIQEAIKMKINEDEKFRQKVEDFYEQSLVTLLLDRKFASLVVDVTEDELARYEQYLSKKLTIEKIVYPSWDDAMNRKNGMAETITADFAGISDDLKFIVLNLEIGKSCPPVADSFGYVVYKLEKVEDAGSGDMSALFDIKKVSIFLQDKKKEEIVVKWIKTLRKNADIWREK